MALAYQAFIMLVGIISQVSAVDNCFFAEYLTLAYTLPDTSGNYTFVGEYWMKHNEEGTSMCELLIDTDTKMTWYSSDIAVDVLYSWQTTDGECKSPEQAPGVPADPKPYEWGWPIVMGSEDVVTETNPIANEGTLCLVKYTIKNFNKFHDLRVQLFKIGDASDLEEGANFIASSVALGLMAVLAFII